MWALPELIEAAARTGKMPHGRRCAGPAGRDDPGRRHRLGLGIEARSRALLSEGEAAEDWYREAIDRLGRTQLRPELARAHLLYGEWLRREAAAPRPASSCAPPTRCSTRWAWRLRRTGPARAAGHRGDRPQAHRPAAAEASEELTAQEAQVARLARDGLSNPEIGARLFISARTVQYHLSKVFAKLGITSRGQLHRVLPGAPDAPGR